MTRAERKARNVRAHAIRRSMVAADWDEAKRDGLTITWREIADTYAAMDTDTVLASFGELETEPAAVVPVAAKRPAPAHIRAASEAYREAREVWERGLELAVAGGYTLAAGGRPAAGETYPDEERIYRAENPAPTWKAFLQAGATATGPRA